MNTITLNTDAIKAATDAANAVQTKLESDLQLLRSCLKAFELASEHDSYKEPELYWPDLLEVVQSLVPGDEAVSAISKIVPDLMRAGSPGSTGVVNVKPYNRRVNRSNLGNSQRTEVSA